MTPPTTNVSSFGTDFGFCTVRVEAVNALGPSGNSSITMATVIAVPNMPPSQPVSYVCKSKSSGTTFSWVAQRPFSLANLTVLSALSPGSSVLSRGYNGSNTTAPLATPSTPSLPSCVERGPGVVFRLIAWPISRLAV